MNTVDDLTFADLSLGTHEYMLRIFVDNLGTSYALPVIVVKASIKGPVVIVSALIHGNELNGLGVVQELLPLVPKELVAGTVVFLPVLNIPGLANKERFFPGKIDLNWFFPGDAQGKTYERYTDAIFSKLIVQGDYLIDLHTARNGGANCYHVRGNMLLPKTRKSASLLNAELMLHGVPTSTTLRGAAEEQGLVSLTLEIGNPHVMQKELIMQASTGILNVLSSLKMIKKSVPVKAPLSCEASVKMESPIEGLLEVFPPLLSFVKKGELVAEVKDVYGKVQKKFFAEKSGIVIGKTTVAVIKKGRTIIHIGLVSEKTFNEWVKG